MEKEMMREQLSVMLDGELDETGMARIFSELDRSGLKDEAEVYFMIGDVLRKGEGFQVLSRTLTDTVRKRLQTETYLSVDLAESSVVDESGRLTIDV